MYIPKNKDAVDIIIPAHIKKINGLMFNLYFLRTVAIICADKNVKKVANKTVDTVKAILTDMRYLI
jgi:hypothetical protein